MWKNNISFIWWIFTSKLNNADIIAKDVSEIPDIVKNINLEFQKNTSNLDLL